MEILRHGKKIIKCPECRSIEVTNKDKFKNSYDCKNCGCFFIVLPNGDLKVVLKDQQKKCPDCESLNIESREYEDEKPKQRCVCNICDCLWVD